MSGPATGSGLVVDDDPVNIHLLLETLKGQYKVLAPEIAHTHHERRDGGGYPRGLAGEEIPLAGRMMALADVFVALASRRVYKPPLPLPQAVEIIGDGLGSFFDPQMVDAFGEIKEDFRRVGLVHADFDEERAALEQTR